MHFRGVFGLEVDNNIWHMDPITMVSFCEISFLLNAYAVADDNNRLHVDLAMVMCILHRSFYPLSADHDHSPKIERVMHSP